MNGYSERVAVQLPTSGLVVRKWRSDFPGAFCRAESDRPAPAGPPDHKYLAQVKNAWQDLSVIIHNISSAER